MKKNDKNEKMIYLPIKPLSANRLWQGRRFRSPAYNKYSKDILLLLPKLPPIDKKAKLKVELFFAFSSPLADIDNPIKGFLDLLQIKYNFNDKQIWRLEVDKEKTLKGQEYTGFNISVL